MSSDFYFDLLSVKETARVLNVPSHRIYYELRRDHCFNGLPVFQIGRRLYFAKDDVFRYAVHTFMENF